MRWLTDLLVVSAPFWVVVMGLKEPPEARAQTTTSIGIVGIPLVLSQHPSASTSVGLAAEG